MAILFELSINNYSIAIENLNNLEVLNWQSLNFQSLWAQSVSDPNVLGQMVSIWNNFIRSGQVWALLLGFMLGYLLRGITA